LKSVKTLKTKRLILRPPVIQDAASIQKYVNDWEVVKYLSNQIPWPYPENGAVDFLENVVFPSQGKDNWFWAICFKDRPEHLIGLLELWLECSPCNRGFWLGREFWGQGIMPEAAEAVNSHAFNELGFERLVFSNAVENKNSRRVKEKTGATFLNHSTNIFVGGEKKATEIWELRKENWSKNALS